MTHDAGDDAAMESLCAALQADPRSHDFFAVMRRIESLRPDWPRWGRALRPSQEALRLSQEPDLDFAPAALETFERRAGGVPRLGVRFFGLLGPQGPMPLHLTEYARERLRLRGDPTLARFLDVFHHRLLALFYRAWAQGQPTVQHDRPDDDRFAAWLGAAFGAEPGAARVPDLAQLHQAGLLGARSRHPEGLSKVLSGYFGVPVRVLQHVAQRLPIAPEDRTRLGGGRGGHAQLGRDATSGRRLHDRQYKFRIALGPLTLAQYRGFLPDAAAWPVLRDWVRQYAGLDLRWDVQLVLARAEVPEPRLGRRVQLGVTSWIGRRGRDTDRGELRLRPGTSFLLRPGDRHA